MNIITRYVLGQTFKIFFLSLLIMSVGLSLFFVTEATLKKGVPISLSLRLVPYIIPEVLSFAIPGMILFATTTFCTKMNASYEIIALKAMGIPPWRVFLPLWIFAILLSCFSVWINNCAASWGRSGMARIVINGMETTITNKLRTDKRFSANKNNVYIDVAGVDSDGTFRGVSFSMARSGGGKISGTAGKARFVVDTKSMSPSLNIELSHVKIEANDKIASLENFSYSFSFEDLGIENYRVEPSIKQVGDAIAKVEEERASFRRSLASWTAFGLMTGSFDIFHQNDWNHRLFLEKNLDRIKNRYLLMGPRHWASGFSAFFFVWIGVPFAIWLNRTDFFTSFFACFIPILLIYYPLLMFGLECGKKGTLPPSCVWMGNIFLGVAGLWFLKKIHRH